MQWLTRYGTVYEARGGQFGSGAPYAIDEAKGTARYDYEARCGRCGGAGGGDQWKHTGWTCFECGGSGRDGTKTERLYTAERLAKLNATEAKREARRAEKARIAQEASDAKKAAARKSFEQANPELSMELHRHAVRFEEGESETLLAIRETRSQAREYAREYAANGRY